jgi:membrane-associated protein
LGEVSWIESNIEIALILIVVISVLPMAIEIWRHRRANRK